MMSRHKWLLLSLLMIAVLSSIVVWKLFIFKMQLERGGCSTSYSRYIEQKGSEEYKVSFCDKFDKNRMKIVTAPRKRAKYVMFEYIGYPNHQGVQIYIEDELGNRLKADHLHDSAKRWKTAILSLPEGMKGDVHVVAQDNASDSYGWVGIGNVRIFDSMEVFKLTQYAETFGWIILFSWVVSTLYGYFLRYWNRLDAYVLSALFVGVVSLITFYVYLFSVNAGKVLSILFFVFVLVSFLFIRKEDRKNIISLFVLFVSMISMVIFLAYSNMEHIDNIQSVSSNKWFYLPVDSWIPKLFSNGILNGHIPSPLIPGWLSSDRPPLQTGLYLLFSLFSYSDLSYLIVAIGAQTMVIVLVILLLQRYVKENIYILITAILIFFNAFTFVNMLFVWPKLFSALYQGIALYCVVRIWDEKHFKMEYILVFAVASALAFLSHGGSIFYLLALAVLIVVKIKKADELKRLVYGLGTALLMYLPWVLYQKLFDPPGDRLLKLHLAAWWPLTDKSFFQVFREYYSTMSIEKWLHIRLLHIKDIFDSLYIHLAQLWTMSTEVWHRNIFYHLDYSYLAFSIVFIVLYWFKKERFGDVQTWLFLLIASFFIHILVWILVLASSTIIHQGAYFGWFSGFLAVTLVVYRFDRRLFYLFTMVNLAIFFRFYVSDFLFGEDILSSTVFSMMVAVFCYTLYRMLFYPQSVPNRKGEV